MPIIGGLPGLRDVDGRCLQIGTAPAPLYPVDELLVTAFNPKLNGTPEQLRSAEHQHSVLDCLWG